MVPLFRIKSLKLGHPNLRTDPRVKVRILVDCRTEVHGIGALVDTKNSPPARGGVVGADGVVDKQDLILLSTTPPAKLAPLLIQEGS